MSKTKSMTLASKIRNIKPHERIAIGGKKERIEACKIIKVFRDSGVLTLDVITMENKPGEFEVVAI